MKSLNFFRLINLKGASLICAVFPTILGLLFSVITLTIAKGQNEFITEWETTAANQSITIPTTGTGYNYTVDWGDGNTDTGILTDATHSYTASGSYVVKISGSFPRIYFAGSTGTNRDRLKRITQWGNISWGSMAGAFQDCSNMTLANTAGVPDLSAVTDMSYMFAGCSSFNTNINNWNVTNIRNGAHLFENCISYDKPLDNWQLTEIRDLSYVFAGCISFNSLNFDIFRMRFGPVDASFAYYNCSVYNKSSNWPFNGDRESMFENCTVFNNTVPLNIGISPSFDWSVVRMFKNCATFNQPISVFTSGGALNLDITEMLAGATAFNQDLSSWDVRYLKLADDFMDGVTLSSTNYDALLDSWSNQNIGNNNVNISFGNSKYCMAEAARAMLTDTYNWNLTDGGIDFSCFPDNAPFITTWTTTSANESITIPTFPGETYNYAVDWGDGEGSLNQADAATHVYTNPGTYTVLIFGDFPRIYFNNSGDKDKLTTIEEWGDQVWTSMSSAFYGCSNMILADPADLPDLSAVTDLSYMFAGCCSFNTNINDWDVTSITTANHLFEDCTSYNQPLDNWQLGSIEDLSYVFAGCTSFNSPNFDVSRMSNGIVTASFAYYNCSAYNQPSNWPMEGSTESMFENCTVFNNTIRPQYTYDGSIEVSPIRMFRNCPAFNQPITVNTVTGQSELWVTEMFSGATTFNQDLSSWDVRFLFNADGFMDGVTLSTANYDALLNSWATQDLNWSYLGINISFGNSQYCDAEAARTTLINDEEWNLTDGGANFSCLPQEELFITTWTTTTSNESITIPTFPGETYDYAIDWGEGPAALNQTGDATHVYADPGTYTISIYGDFPRIYFNNSGDKEKLTTIEQWGNQIWTSMFGAFHGCSNMTLSNLAGIPDLSVVSNMSYMFADCSSFNTNINNWDVTNIKNGAHLFENCVSYNQPLDDWFLPNVTSLNHIFAGCTSFNSLNFNSQSINLNALVNASYAYYNCISYNQPSRWPSQGTHASMFENCIVFNNTPPQLSYDPSGSGSSPGAASRMFKNCVAFNQPVYLFAPRREFSSEMIEMFAGAIAFDQDLSGWVVENIEFADGFMDGVTLSAANYDAILESWATQDLFEDVNISFGNSKYCNAEPARSILTDTYGWNITDGGVDFTCLIQDELFITTWTTTAPNESITIPTYSGETYDYSIDWGDGFGASDQTGDATHVYANPGTYTISISGSFPRIYFNNSGDKSKLTSIEQWGNQAWTSMEGAFHGCSNMTLSPTAGAPDLSGVTNMAYMFAGCSNFNTNINDWDVSTLEDGAHSI